MGHFFRVSNPLNTLLLTLEWHIPPLSTKTDWWQAPWGHCLGFGVTVPQEQLPASPFLIPVYQQQDGWLSTNPFI